jgi:hypothetical protein
MGSVDLGQADQWVYTFGSILGNRQRIFVGMKQFISSNESLPVIAWPVVSKTAQIPPMVVCFSKIEKILIITQIMAAAIGKGVDRTEFLSLFVLRVVLGVSAEIIQKI